MMHRLRLFASLLVGTAIAFPSTMTGIGAVEHAYVDRRVLPTARPAMPSAAVANDNRVPAGTHVGDTLLLRLTVTPAAWHILADSAPAFTVAAF